MLNVLATAFQSVAESTGLVSKWYGVVRPVLDAKGRSYPSSCTANLSDCDDMSRYAPAVPNSDEAGIAYLEIRGGYTTSLRTQTVITYSYPLRLVVWFNAAKAGFQPCDAITATVQKTLKCMFTAKQVLTDGTGSPLATVQVNNMAVNLNQPEIFRPYSYQDKANLYVWPYAVFAIDFTATVDVPAGCIDYQDLTPVTCVCV